MVAGDAALTARLMPPGYKARAEQVIPFTVNTLDANCPLHSPQLLEAADVAGALAVKDREIAALQAELARLKAGHRSSTGNTVK